MTDWPTVYLVAGLSGVGKSSVVQYALKKAKGIKGVNFGDAILWEAAATTLVLAETRLLKPNPLVSCFKRRVESVRK